MEKKYKHWEVAYVVTQVIRTEVMPEAGDDEPEMLRKHECSLVVLATEAQQALVNQLSAIGIAADDIHEVGVKEVK